MKKTLFCLFLAVFFFSCSSPPAESLAICAIFKNEAKWLKEWVEYHHKVLGVDHFYLYNNESSDEYQKVLEPFIRQGIVELIDWDSSSPDHLASGPFMDAPWSMAQLGAYNNCLKQRALGKVDWVAMIDIDEFIVPAKGVSHFYSLLAKAKKHRKGTVSIHWKVFGTSGVQDLGSQELLTEKLTLRAKEDHPWNSQVKSIHRPEAVEFCLVHIAEKLKPGFGARSFSPEEVQINHYWARTIAFSSKRRALEKEKTPELFEALNQVEDQTIFQYLSKIKS